MSLVFAQLPELPEGRVVNAGHSKHAILSTSENTDLQSIKANAKMSK